MENWKTIPDNQIRHVWADENGEEITISPAWYEDNGTPVGDNGDDMKYIRTEIIG